MSSSPYRLELAEQLASEDENEHKSEEDPAPNSLTRNIAASEQIAEATSTMESGIRTADEAVQGSLFDEIQKAGSTAGEGSSSGEAASDNLLRSSSPPAEQGQSSSGLASIVLATPSGVNAVEDSAGDATDEAKGDRDELRETSVDPTCRTMSTEGSPSKPMKAERYSLPALTPAMTNTPAGLSTKANPSKSFATTASKPLPLAVQRTQVVGQSPSVNLRKNRYLDSIQKLNQGGIDHEVASSDTTTDVKRIGYGPGNSQRSSRHASEEPENEGKNVSLPRRKQESNAAAGSDPLSKSEDIDAAASTSVLQENHEAEDKGVSSGVKRKADVLEVNKHVSSKDVDTKSDRPIKRARQNNVWKKVAANTGVFALGAFTAVAGLLFWPEEE